MKCEICGKECNGLNGLSLHITKLHHNNQEYYDTYLKKDGEGICINCGKPTLFLGFGKGYNTLCPNCEMENSKSSQCKICGQFCKNLQALHTHIRLHKISTKDYYDTYLKQEGDGFCRVCHKPTKFLGIRGYKLHCGCSCAQLDKETQRKLKETSLERYGTESPNQSEIVKAKQQKSMEEKFGVKHSLQSEELKEKCKNTMLERYGVENMFQYNEVWRKGVDKSRSPEAKTKRKLTCRERYGVDHPWSNEEVQQKTKQTLKDKYGSEIENSFQAEEVKEKSKTTMMEKFGVPYSQQSEELKEKAKKTVKKNKSLDAKLNQDNM